MPVLADVLRSDNLDAFRELAVSCRVLLSWQASSAPIHLQPPA